MLHLTIFCIILFGSAFSAPSVQNTATGVTYLGINLGGSDAYYGIKYGSIPKRWALSTAFQPNSGTTVDGSSQNPNLKCIQKDGSGGDDCLYLNVYTPAGASSSSNLPVRIYIHGGSFNSGSAHIYSGEFVAPDGMVVVIINYRVGNLGFFAHPDLAVENGGRYNYGLYDQRVAMNWVKNNVQYFGGNPNNVALWGESAGASSIVCHLVMTGSFSLYHKVILESPGPFNFFNTTEALKMGTSIIAQVGQPFVIVRNPTFVPSSMVAAVPSPPYGQPVLDSELTEQPLTLLRSGSWNKVPIIIGVNQDEGNYFADTLFPSGKTVAQTGKLLNDAYGVRPESIATFVDLYNWPSVWSDSKPEVSSSEFQSFSQFIGDYFINCGSKAIMDYTQSEGKTFVYQFTQLPPIDVEIGQLGATHTAELPYVFKAIEYYRRLGQSYTDYDRDTSLIMADLFKNFGETGEPSTTLFGISWAHYENTSSGNAVNFGVDDVKVSSFPTFDNCERVLPFLHLHPQIVGAEQFTQPATKEPTTVAPTTTQDPTTENPTTQSTTTTVETTTTPTTLEPTTFEPTTDTIPETTNAPTTQDPTETTTSIPTNQGETTSAPNESSTLLPSSNPATSSLTTSPPSTDKTSSSSSSSTRSVVEETSEKDTVKTSFTFTYTASGITRAIIRILGDLSEDEVRGKLAFAMKTNYTRILINNLYKALEKRDTVTTADFTIKEDPVNGPNSAELLDRLIYLVENEPENLGFEVNGSVRVISLNEDAGVSSTSGTFTGIRRVNGSSTVAFSFALIFLISSLFI